MENQDIKYADTNFGTKTSILRILLSVSEVSGPYNQFTFPFEKNKILRFIYCLRLWISGSLIPCKNDLGFATKIGDHL